jgi:protein-S-isoprenylcysteine O-methyltransferase Ste14
LFLVTIVFAALDVGRLHQSDGVPPSWHLPAILVFSAALILQAAAMIVNPFFSPALRIQHELGHSVITCGPYQIVRHPGYLAMLIAVPASAIAVGSWLALIPAFAFSVVIVRRTALEDRYLRQVLPGYLEFTESVRYRLLPGIW